MPLRRSLSLATVSAVLATTAALAGPATTGTADSAISSPSDLQASFVQWYRGTDRVHLSWTAPPEAFDRTVVMFGATPTPATSIAQLDPTQTSVDLDVTPQTGDVVSFLVYVMRDSDSSRSPSSSVAVVSDLPLGPQLQVSPVSGVAGQVALSWSAPADGDQLVLRQVTNAPDVLADGLPIDLADPTVAGSVVQSIGSATTSPSYELFEQSLSDPDQVSPGSVGSSRPAPAPLTGLSIGMRDDPTSLQVAWQLPSGCPSQQYHLMHCLEARVALKEGTTAPTSPTDGDRFAPAPGDPPIENFGTMITGLVPGHTYTVSVFNTYGSPEAYSPAATQTILFKDSVFLTATGTVPTLVTYGTSVTVKSLAVRQSNLAVLPGLPINLQTPHGTAPVVVAHGVTDVAGVASMTFRPVTSTSYQLSSAATSELGEGGGPTFAIAVRPVISLGLSHYTVRHGTTVTIGGTLNPHLATHLTLQRYGSGRWLSIGTFTTSSVGSFSGHIHTTARGAWSYRVVRTGDRTLATGISRTVRLTAT